MLFSETSSSQVYSCMNPTEISGLPFFDFDSLTIKEHFHGFQLVNGSVPPVPQLFGPFQFP